MSIISKLYVKPTKEWQIMPNKKPFISHVFLEKSLRNTGYASESPSLRSNSYSICLVRIIYIFDTNDSFLLH